MPATIVSTSATKSFLMTSPQLSVNFGGALQRLFQLLQRKILAAGDLENRCLAARAELAGIRYLGGDIVRDHDGPVTIGVNEVVGAHGHAGNANLGAKIFRVHPCMRRTDRARKRLESRRPLRNVADRSIGDHAEAAERLVHVALHLAPERAVSDVGAVDILNHANARTKAAADIFVVIDASL